MAERKRKVSHTSGADQHSTSGHAQSQQKNHETASNAASSQASGAKAEAKGGDAASKGGAEDAPVAPQEGAQQAPADGPPPGMGHLHNMWLIMQMKAEHYANEGLLSCTCCGQCIPPDRFNVLYIGMMYSVPHS